MKQLALLTKTLLRQTFRLDKSKKQNNSTLVAYIILGVVCLPLLIVLAVLTYVAGGFAAQIGAEASILTLLITFCQLIVIFFGVPVILNAIYFSKDNEILLALPVKPGIVFLVKFLIAYLIEFVTSFIMMVFAVVPFVIGSGAGISIGLFFALFIVPLLPLLLAAIIAIPLMYVVSFFKNKGIFSTIALLLLFSTFFMGYYVLLGQIQTEMGIAESVEQMIVNISAALDKFADIVFPNKFLAISMTEANFGIAALNFLYVIGINALLVGTAFFISSLVYRSSVSKQLENPKSQSNRKAEFATQGRIRTLIMKDVKEIVRYPSLGFYCLFQIIFAPIMIFVMTMPAMMGGGTGEEAFSLADLAALNPSMTAMIILAMFMFMVFSMNYAAGTAISRENFNFYILKILPVPYEEMLDAKGILGFIFNEIGVIIALIVCVIVLKLAIVPILLVFITASLFGYGFSYFQVYMDLCKPKLFWDTPAKGLKNAASIYITMMLSLAVIVVLVVSYILFSLLNSSVTDYIYWALVFLAGLGFALLSRWMLMSKATEKIEMIES